METQAHCGRGRHRDDGFTVVLQGDQRRPRLVATHEAPRAVDRIDDPAPGRVPIADDSELLADDRVVGAFCTDALAGVAFDGPVRLGHRRQVRLRVDLEIVGTKPLHGDAVGDVCQLEREGKVVSHRR